MSDFDLDSFLKDRKKEISERDGKPFEEVVKEIIVNASAEPTFTEEAREEARKLIPWAKKRAARVAMGLEPDK